jgi:hypothetical protein
MRVLGLTAGVLLIAAAAGGEPKDRERDPAAGFKAAAHREVDLSQKSWTVLTYRNIPGHDLNFENSQIVVAVRSSAGPLVLPTLRDDGRPRRFAAVRLEFTVQGSLRPQPAKWGEDSVLRLGLVKPGPRTLTWAQRLVAPDWIKRLFSLAPAGSGVDSIEFANVVERAEQVGLKRVHPSSELIVERGALVGGKSGQRQTLKVELLPPAAVAGIWLSIDGDDTKSDFSTTIHKLEISEIQE